MLITFTEVSVIEAHIVYTFIPAHLTRKAESYRDREGPAGRVLAQNEFRAFIFNALTRKVESCGAEGSGRQGAGRLLAASSARKGGASGASVLRRTVRS